jgi:hypothetical protein
VVKHLIADVLLGLELDLAVLEPEVAELLLEGLDLLRGAQLDPGEGRSLLVERHLQLGLEHLHALVLAELNNLLLGNRGGEVEEKELVRVHYLGVVQVLSHVLGRVFGGMLLLYFFMCKHDF